MARISRTGLLALALAALLAATGRAADDHERAREAVREGRILPLSEILERVARNFRGELIEVELEGGESGGGADARGYRYEIELLGPDGDVTILIYDAATGRQLGARGHDLEDREHEHDDEHEDGGDDD